MDSAFRDQFCETGYAGPVALLDAQQCTTLCAELGMLKPPSDWPKARAAVWPAFYEIGSAPAIVDRVAALIGDDVMLWGASLVRRHPGKIHPWHTDIETSGDEGRAITVWIGLEHTDLNSSPLLIPYSHSFGSTVQERAWREGVARLECTDEHVAAWALDYDPRSRIDRLDMGDGDAVFFDGRIWHGTRHMGHARRTALLLQYATPDMPIRIPVNGDLGWPFQFKASPHPPCVMVRGTSMNSKNRIVRPPSGRKASPSTWVKRLELPLKEDHTTGWRRYPIFHGATTIMPTLSCHVSVLSPGKIPHEPHRHRQEELLIVLSGRPELLIGEGPEQEIRAHPVERGMFAYYPSEQSHTIRNSGSEPATYLMFKWVGDDQLGSAAQLETSIHSIDGAAHIAADQERPFATRRILEGPTGQLRKLHCHVSSLKPGGGYDPHIDAYDVAILVLDGTIEALGKKLGPNSVVFIGAGEPHGMKNVGPDTASYIVFEFHGDRSIAGTRTNGQGAPGRIRKLARRIARRISRRTIHAFDSAKNVQR